MIKKHKAEFINNKYREDINGLRALAVILVLLFHLDITIFKAGFLGVDVFFVISGYLISRNILHELQFKQFSFKTFYTKRFKRLFPALFFTLSVCLFIGYLLLAPSNLERLGKSSLSGLFSVSNLFFLSEKGYFNLESEFKPLLHVWSLSLEEQFYLVWPFILFVFFKFLRGKIFAVLLLLTIISLVSSSYYISTISQAVFYLLPFRMFEFILGALVIWLERYRFDNRNFLEPILIAGMIMVVYSSINFDQFTPMPGFYSLIPCVGTMLIIYAGESSRSGIILKNKVFDLVGKSSYSIYLAHWPLIVYTKYYTLAELTTTLKILIGALSLIIGYLMWRYIENPFRYKNLNIKKTDYIWFAMPVSILFLSFFAINIWISKGYPSRYPSALYLSHEEMIKERNNYWSDVKSHTIQLGSNKKKVIVMGNSHAIDLIYALKNNGLQADIILLPTTHLCYNFGTAINKVNIEKCSLRKNENFKNENWSTADAIYLHDDWRKKDFQNLEKILSEIRNLSNVPIFVFGPKMTFKKSVSDIVYSCKSSLPKTINKYAQKFSNQENKKALNESLAQFFKNTYSLNENIFYVDILAAQTNAGNQFEVVSLKKGKFLYFDRAHFTERGSTEFGAKLKKTNPHIFNLSFTNN